MGHGLSTGLLHRQHVHAIDGLAGDAEGFAALPNLGEEVERCCDVPMAYWLFSITKITGSFHRAAMLKVS